MCIFFFFFEMMSCWSSGLVPPLAPGLPFFRFNTHLRSRSRRSFRARLMRRQRVRGVQRMRRSVKRTVLPLRYQTWARNGTRRRRESCPWRQLGMCASLCGCASGSCGVGGALAEGWSPQRLVALVAMHPKYVCYGGVR